MASEQYWRGWKKALEGGRRSYGCHFGMRSTLEQDKADFFRGFDDAIAWRKHIMKLKNEYAS